MSETVLLDQWVVLYSNGENTHTAVLANSETEALEDIRRTVLKDIEGTLFPASLRPQVDGIKLGLFLGQAPDDLWDLIYEYLSLFPEDGWRIDLLRCQAPDLGGDGHEA